MNIALSEIQNGVVWITTGPATQVFISQWIDRDQWVLLSNPIPAVHSGSCLIVYTEKDGTVIRTQEETRQLLHWLGAQKYRARLTLSEMG